MSRKTLYLVLLLVGIVVPMSAFLPWATVHGLHARLFAQELFANRVSTAFVLDLLLTALCVIYLAWRERGSVRLWWAPIVATLLLGVSAGLPLLLYLREDATSKN